MTLNDIAAGRTYLRNARDCVRAEQDVTTARAAGFRTFADRVESVSPQTPTPHHSASPAGSPPAPVGAVATAQPATDSGCQAVRHAFAETVRPHSIEDIDEPESLPETIAAEFTSEIGMMLASDTEQQFTAELKQAVLTEAGTRREESEAVVEALDAEGAYLRDVSETVAEITDWVIATNETALSKRDFDDLAGSYETLATFREQCHGVVHERQESIRTTQYTAGSTHTSQRNCMELAYRTLSVDHPVLATIAELDQVCAECQRSVRAHLMRRG
jgi:hypothetical protein